MVDLILTAGISFMAGYLYRFVQSIVDRRQNFEAAEHYISSHSSIHLVEIHTEDASELITINDN